MLSETNRGNWSAETLLKYQTPIRFFGFDRMGEPEGRWLYVGAGRKLDGNRVALLIGPFTFKGGSGLFPRTPRRYVAFSNGFVGAFDEARLPEVLTPDQLALVPR